MSTDTNAKLTDEEHQARAMLLGLSYHHGNGDPIYFKEDVDGTPQIASMLDANTLERIVQPQADGMIDWAGMGRAMKARRRM